MDITARHFTDDGRPLLYAVQVASMADVKVRTVYQWERRGYLKARGLDDCNNRLYDAGEAAMVAASPRNRKAA